MSTTLRRAHFEEKPEPVGVHDYRIKRDMLARIRQFMSAHLDTLPADRRREALAEARRFSRVTDEIEEDLSRLDQMLKAQARRTPLEIRN